MKPISSNSLWNTGNICIVLLVICFHLLYYYHLRDRIQRYISRMLTSVKRRGKLSFKTNHASRKIFVRFRGSRSLDFFTKLSRSLNFFQAKKVSRHRTSQASIKHFKSKCLELVEKRQSRPSAKSRIYHSLEQGLQLTMIV